MKIGEKLAVQTSRSDHFKGSFDAPVQFVEYGDYECPYCGQAFIIVSKLQETFGDDLCYVFRNFPLTQLHPHALMAAKAAEAAGLQKKFWKMHERLYENQDDLDEDSLFEYAQDLGLNIKQFSRAIVSPTVARKVEEDRLSGQRSGIDGTPSFFINGYRYRGDWSYESLHEILNAIRQGISPEDYLGAA
jgi:protein-disulfide isomerase